MTASTTASTTATAAPAGGFRIERTAHITAQPATVYALVEDFHRWTEWSPWEHQDTDLKRTYSGAAQGLGAAYAWEGKKTGKGGMEITGALPANHLVIRLNFEKPFAAQNTAEFSFEPVGDGTRVTWAMYGPKPKNFLMSLMCDLFGMNDMVGKQFDAGLAKLKTVAEA
jgi:hypothetical protein